MAIPRPAAYTREFAADEVKSGTGRITIQADVQAFARLIDAVVTYDPFRAAVRALVTQSQSPIPQARPSYVDFIQQLKDMNLG